MHRKGPVGLNLQKTIPLFFIRLYQRGISPWMMPCCRFSPSCSQYMHEAIETYGLLKGARRGVWRLLRCQPFCHGGYDPLIKTDKGSLSHHG